MRVPGAQGSLLEAKAEGRGHPHGLLAAGRAADREKRIPNEKWSSFAIGFETTAPSTALTLKAREGRGDQELQLHVQPRHDRGRRCAALAGLAGPAARRVFIGPGQRGRPSSAARPFEFIPADLRQAGGDRGASSRWTSCRRSR